MKRAHPKSLSRAWLVCLALSLAQLFSSCASTTHKSLADTGIGSRPTLEIMKAQHNVYDVEFADHMIPHHLLALDMVKIANLNAVSGELSQFNSAIYGGQDVEVELLRTWLRLWGRPPAPGDHPLEPHLEIVIHDYPITHGAMGMMSVSRMETLRDTKGPAFDQLYLQMMIEHHEGAVAMAQEELDKGVFEPAKALARNIVKVQREQIAQMREMAARFPEDGPTPSQVNPF